MRLTNLGTLRFAPLPDASARAPWPGIDYAARYFFERKVREWSFDQPSLGDHVYANERDTLAILNLLDNQSQAGTTEALSPRSAAPLSVFVRLSSISGRIEPTDRLLSVII